MALTFTIPGLKLISEANQSEHWRVKARRKKDQQKVVMVFWRNTIKRKITLPCQIALTRIGCRKLDADNLAGSFKHVQDQIAREIGCDDGSSLVTWSYHQQPGTRNYQLQIEIKER